MHNNLIRFLMFWGFCLLAACGGGGGSSISGNTPAIEVNAKQMGGAIQTDLSSLSLVVSTLAGSTTGSADGTGTTAKFNAPIGITTDGKNLYVADYLNATIRKVDIATGAVTTIAGSAGTFDYSDGNGASARFRILTSITTDGMNLYIADDCMIRKMNLASGEVTTLAGSPSARGTADGVGASARLSPSIYGLTTDGTNLYATESFDFTIRKIVIASGAVTTLAGSAGNTGSLDGIGNSARFAFPMGITTDGTNLFVADQHTIRRVVIATGAVTTIVGSAVSMGSNDGIGSSASFDGLHGITSDGANLYVADIGRTIRRINIATAVVTTLAGTPSVTGSTDGIGPSASFSNAFGLTTDGTSIFVIDAQDQRVRQIK